MTLINDKTFPTLQYLTSDNMHGVTTIFSTRNGGFSGQTPETEHLRSMNLLLRFSPDEEDYDNVGKNYEAIMSSQGFDFKSLVTLRQRHTNNVIAVDEYVIKSNHNNPFGFNRLPETADALVTNIKDILLSVRTADCVPILLYDSRNEAIGAIHAGWRGTFTQIGTKTVERMTELYGTKPADIKAAIGPAIDVCCYEVDDIFYENFRMQYGKEIDNYFTISPGNKPHCDLKKINKSFLIEAGVLASNIEVSDLCTMCNPELFYSHRRSGNKRGTMASFIGMK